jgi:hypothetical protein
MTMAAASCWAWVTRRRCRASTTRRAAAVLAPAPRSALTRLGGAAGGGPAASLGVVVVLAVLGADRPPRHQQTLRARPGDRVRVDDPQIHPRHPARIWL